MPGIVSVIVEMDREMIDSLKESYHWQEGFSHFVSDKHLIEFAGEIIKVADKGLPT
jgi:hypothetical protein